jgi:hypothetical protein
LEDEKEWKNKGKTRKMFRITIIKEKKNLLAFRKQKNGKIGQETQKIFLFLKKQKKGKQSNEKGAKTRILLLEF